MKKILVLITICISIKAFAQPGQSEMYAKASDAYLQAASKTKCPDRARVLRKYAAWNQCMVDVLAGKKSSCTSQPTTPIAPCEDDMTGSSSTTNKSYNNNASTSNTISAAASASDAVGAAIGFTIDLINQGKRNKWNRQYLEIANDFQSRYGVTINTLENAVEINDTEAMKQMIEKGIDVNVDIINENETLLYYATQENKLEIVKLLINAGADVNKANSKKPDVYSGMTPLHIAAFNGNLELVQLLVEKGADKNAQTEFWRTTPIHMAIRKNNLDVIKYLKSAGADLTLTIK